VGSAWDGAMPLFQMAQHRTAGLVTVCVLCVGKVIFLVNQWGQYTCWPLTESVGLSS
jgi:hypothetical protein